MDEATQAEDPDARAAPLEAPERRTLPPVSNAERAFWRRAVDLERARIQRGQPAQAARHDA
ncbi:MAG TPA: hypothetical protein VIK49_04655 [Steroidobacteraceae bacterium]